MMMIQSTRELRYYCCCRKRDDDDRPMQVVESDGPIRSCSVRLVVRTSVGPSAHSLQTAGLPCFSRFGSLAFQTKTTKRHAENTNHDNNDDNGLFNDTRDSTPGDSGHINKPIVNPIQIEGWDRHPEGTRHSLGTKKQQHQPSQCPV